MGNNHPFQTWIIKIRLLRYIYRYISYAYYADLRAFMKQTHVSIVYGFDERQSRHCANPFNRNS